MIFIKPPMVILLQRVTKGCHLSWLTNNALVYEPNEYSCTHRAQVNFGDLTPYLKVHKREKFFSSDFEFFTILYLVKLKY